MSREPTGDEELLQRGYDALVRELGLVGMIRFVQQLRPGTGDYAEERHKLLEGETVASFVEKIRALEPQDSAV